MVVSLGIGYAGGLGEHFAGDRGGGDYAGRQSAFNPLYYFLIILIKCYTGTKKVNMESTNK